MKQKSPLRQALATAKAAGIAGALTVLPPRARLSVQYWRAFHRRLNLRAPKLFTEKVQALKLNPWLARQGAWSDKIEAKATAADILGEDWIIPTLWSGATLPPRAERTWPAPFFIKASHGSGWNRYVATESDKDWASIERECAKWLATPWPQHLMEAQYDATERRLLVEPRIGTDAALPMDYKFWVFKGRVEYISLTLDRLTDIKAVFLDRDWRPIEQAYRGFPLPDVVPEPAANYASMLAAAERIGGFFPFARVDFYDLPEGPKFGEVTLTPGAGFVRGHPPDEIDGRMGDMLDLSAYETTSPL